MEDNCYDLLGVAKDAGGLTIKRAYRKLATEWCVATAYCSLDVAVRTIAHPCAGAQAPGQEP